MGHQGQTSDVVVRFKQTALKVSAAALMVGVDPQKLIVIVMDATGLQKMFRLINLKARLA